MIAIKQVTLSNFPAVVTASRAHVSQISVVPSVGASGSVVLGNEVDGNFVAATGTYTAAMTAEQYAAWGTDDDYAVNCFLANLGLVRV